MMKLEKNVFTESLIVLSTFKRDKEDWRDQLGRRRLKGRKWAEDKSKFELNCLYGI